MQRETDAAYFTRRAREEAQRALQADRPEVVAAHHGLAVRYEMLAAQCRQEEAAAIVSARDTRPDVVLDVVTVRHLKVRTR